MRILVPILVLFLLLPAGGRGQSSAELSRRQRDLQSIRDQIQGIENQIREQQKKEMTSLELLENYDRRAGLVRRLVGRLRSDAEDLQVRIDASRATIVALETQYGFLRDQYARFASSVYKAGPIHDLELLLSASSINQFAIRNEYLKRFSRQRKRDADTIVTRKRDLEEVQARLQVQLGDQQRLIEEKGREEQRLVALARERRDMVARIRNDRKSLQKSLERQTRAARELEGVISSLIEADRVRKAREAEAATKSGKLPTPPPVGGNFETKRGKLRWPVQEGSVVARFGPIVHPKLKTITQNTGIDISVKAGTPVYAVAEGDVATIQWLPWYGNIVILNHSGGYRTIYTHLEDIRVGEGQRVKEGEAIASSGETVDGPRLHFEIWKDHDKQNPESWLTRQ